MAKPIDKNRRPAAPPPRTQTAARPSQTQQRSAPPPQSRAVATQTRREVSRAEDAPDFLKGKEMTGVGVSDDASDSLVPIVVILQDGNPEVKPRDPKYIEGAEASMIWLKNDDEPFVPGDEGILAQACYFDKDFVEWVPRSRGGGFVGRHRTIPDDAERVADPQNPNKVKWVRRSNQNEIVETRSYTVRLFRENGARTEHVIPFTSSGHTVARDWMTRLRKVMVDGQRANLWAKLWRLTTKVKTNTRGESWFIFNVEDAGWVPTEEDYEAGMQLHNAFAKGEMRADDSTFDEGLHDTGDAGQDDGTGRQQGGRM